MKTLLTIFFLFFTASVFAQDINLPPESGKKKKKGKQKSERRLEIEKDLKSGDKVYGPSLGTKGSEKLAAYIERYEKMRKLTPEEANVREYVLRGYPLMVNNDVNEERLYRSAERKLARADKYLNKRVKRFYRDALERKRAGDTKKTYKAYKERKKQTEYSSNQFNKQFKKKRKHNWFRRIQ